jgi:hypothetical protein
MKKVFLALVLIVMTYSIVGSFPEDSCCFFGNNCCCPGSDITYSELVLGYCVCNAETGLLEYQDCYYRHQWWRGDNTIREENGTGTVLLDASGNPMW